PPSRPPAPAASPVRHTPVPPASAVRPAGHATPAPIPGEFSAEVATHRALLDKLKEQNHFERLGVPQTADTGAVKAAYFKLARAYHPDTVPPGAPPELAKLKEDIFAAIGEAYRTVGDDAGRADYIQELKTGGGEVDVLNILKAEDLFNKACIL